MENDEKLRILRAFATHGAIEQAVHWILASGMDWTGFDTIQNAMGIFFDNGQGVDEKYMWIRAYALINIVYSEERDSDRCMKAFVDLMEATRKFKLFPNIAFNTGLRKIYLEHLPSEPKIRFFTLIANKMYKSAFEGLDGVADNDDEEWKYFCYLAECLKKNLNVLMDVPNEVKYVHVKENKISSMVKSGTRRISEKKIENSMGEISSILIPKKLF